MGVPHVTSFCWCLGLEPGVKFIGVIHMMAALATMVVCAVFAAQARALVGTVEDAGDGLYSRAWGVATGVAVSSVVHVALAGTLLAAVYRRRASGLRVWVWAMLVLAAAALVFIAASAALRGLSDSGSDIFISFLEGTLFFGFLAYSILCVNSYYLMLKSSEDMEGPNKVDY